MDIIWSCVSYATKTVSSRQGNELFISPRYINISWHSSRLLTTTSWSGQLYFTAFCRGNNPFLLTIQIIHRLYYDVIVTLSKIGMMNAVRSEKYDYTIIGYHFRFNIQLYAATIIKKGCRMTHFHLLIYFNFGFSLFPLGRFELDWNER